MIVMLCTWRDGLRREQLARARAVLDQEALLLQPLGDGLRAQFPDIFAFREGGRQADVAREERALAVVEPGHDDVRADLVQAAVGDGRDHFVEREAGGDGFAHLVERERLAQAQVLGREPPLLQARAARCARSLRP